MASVQNIICFEDNLDAAIVDEAKDVDIKIYYMNELIKQGKEIKAAGNGTLNLPNKEDTYMFSYTSGTTGDPKGVKLSHKMIILAGAAVQARMTKPMNEDDIYISYLPASHSFEQAVFGISLCFGMKCGFFRGDVQKLMDDLAILKPTIFPSVPRLYNRIYSSIK